MLSTNTITSPPPLIPPLPSPKKQKYQEQQQSGVDTPMKTKNIRKQIIVNSQQIIKYQDDKSKYRNILKVNFLDNNFKNETNMQNNRNKQKKQSEGSFASTLKGLNRKVHKMSNIIVMLKTQYPLIHNLIHKYFYYKFYNKEDRFDDIFLLWMDTYVTEEFVKRLKSYQRINHFPSSNQLGRKDLLTANLKLAKRVMKQEYQFYPKTWVLPKEYDLFIDQRQKSTLYIVKPHANCQGRGIYLSKNPSLSLKDDVIVQQYMDNPMLIDGSKFDLRIYALLRSLDPLRIYLYKEGLCRLATSQYIKPNDVNIKNEKMHLTNYAINKQDPNFVGNKDLNKDNQGHKRSYTSVIKQLQRKGFDIKKIEERIQSIIVRTILATYTKLLRSYRRTRQYNTSFSPIKEFGKFKEENVSEFNQDEPSVCFQLLGFDIMLLQTGEPILLQINHQPSLIADSPFDMAVKKSLVMDTINMLNLQQKQRQEWQKCQKEGTQYILKNIQQKQLQNKGGFKCIYPLTILKHNQVTKKQKQSIQNRQFLYQTIMNRFLFKQFKDLNKIKLGNYRTITSRVNSRRNQFRNKEVNTEENQKICTTAGQSRKYNRTSASSQKQKAVALTFYNLFNDSKYLIKRGSSFLQRHDHKQENEDHMIKNNQIYLASGENCNIDPGKELQYGLNYAISTSNQKARSKKLTIDTERHNISLKHTSLDEKLAHVHANSPSSVLIDDKFRQNIASIRNRGIMSYIASKRQKKSVQKGQQKPQKLQVCSHSYENKQKQKQKQHQNTNTQTKRQNTSEWKKTINTIGENLKLNNDPKTKMQEFKNIYINSLSQKCQKVVNHHKVSAKEYQKLNFTSFIEKQKKERKEEGKNVKEGSYEEKKTSPSVQ